MTCRVSSRVYLGIGQVTCSEGHLPHLSHRTTKTCSRGREPYGIAPPNSWSYSIPRLAEVRPYNSFIRPKSRYLFRGSPGAIMFNDSLTLEQCKELMGRLAHTSVPFRCAHGRPSIVPLVDLGPPPDIRVARRRVNWEAYEEYMQAQARTFRPR